MLNGEEGTGIKISSVDQISVEDGFIGWRSEFDISLYQPNADVKVSSGSSRSTSDTVNPTPDGTELSNSQDFKIDRPKRLMVTCDFKIASVTMINLGSAVRKSTVGSKWVDQGNIPFGNEPESLSPSSDMINSELSEHPVTGVTLVCFDEDANHLCEYIGGTKVGNMEATVRGTTRLLAKPHQCLTPAGSLECIHLVFLPPS